MLRGNLAPILRPLGPRRHEDRVRFAHARRLVGAASALLATLASGRAFASDEASAFGAASHLEVGMHVGLAHPGGQVGGGSLGTTPYVSDVAPTWVPIGLDAGARLSPWVYVGGSLDLGPTVEQEQLGSCFACGVGYDFQWRAEVRLYAAPRSAVNPWLSVGAGWEALHLALGSGSATASAVYSGPVLANFQFGLDVRARAFAFGPYFGVALAEFTSRFLSPAPAGEVSSVGDLALHEWFTVGVRANYVLF